MLLKELSKEFKDYVLKDHTDLPKKKAGGKELTSPEKQRLKLCQSLWEVAKSKYPYTKERNKTLRDHLNAHGQLPDMGRALLFGLYLEPARRDLDSLKAAHPYTPDWYPSIQAKTSRGIALTPEESELFPHYEKKFLRERGEKLSETDKKRYSVREYEVKLAELERDNPVEFNRPGSNTHVLKTKWLKNVRRLKKRRDKNDQSGSKGGAQ